MIPVISVVGSNSNVGKTTVLCDIIKELKSRGYRVGTIKHDIHDFDIDYPGKDTWMHAKAGADIVTISSPKKLAIIEKLEEEFSIDEVISKIRNVDIIITEGYKAENKPKIEIFRNGISKDIFSNREEVFAIITDISIDRRVPQFSIYEIVKLVDLIETIFLKRNI